MDIAMTKQSDERGLSEQRTMYSQMCLIRAVENAILDLHRSGQVVGSVHLCIGQEAIPVGTCSALDARDPVYATYRGHGWALAKGVRPGDLLAEVCARSGSVNGGRAGSAFLSSAAKRFMGENSIVGAGVPIALGSALASQRDSAPWVPVVAFGDGAINQGSVNESLNFAAAFDLPLIFVCENNGYSELTPISQMVAEPELYRRAAAFGMNAERIDGNDPTIVAEAVTRARGRALEGGGPSFLECVTARLVGHYIGDAEQYRAAGELEQAWKDEPISRLKESLVHQGVPLPELDRIAQKANDTVVAVVEEVLSRPLSPMAAPQEYLYAD